MRKPTRRRGARWRRAAEPGTGSGRSARWGCPERGRVAWRALPHAPRNQGRLRRAGLAARRALALAHRAAQREELMWCRIEFGRVLAASGRWKEAGQLWDRTLAALPVP